MNDNKLISVLHVVPSMSLRAGMTSVVMNYNHAIDSDSVHFDYLYLNPLTDRIPEAESLGANVWYVPFSMKPGGLSKMRSFFCEHSNQFDIVHCHQIFMPELIGPLAKRNGATRIIAHSHSTKFSDKHASAVRNYLVSRFVGAFATDYVACSDAARVLFGRHGDEAYIMHNAVDCKRFSFDERARSEVRTELGIEEDVLLLGNLGRLENQKNQVFLVDIVKQLVDNETDCILVIAGTGSLYNPIKKRAIKLGVEERILLVGDRSDASRLYSAFDIFLLPSLFEGLPVSGVEAQVSGLPCFFSDAITREVSFGSCEFLPINDAFLWAKAIMNLRKSTSRASGPLLAREAGFDIDMEAKRLVEYYCSILG